MPDVRDEVASYMVMPVSGDRSDIKVATPWKNGVLTSVMSRKLVTVSKFDVQFNNLGVQSRLAFRHSTTRRCATRRTTTRSSLQSP